MLTILPPIAYGLAILFVGWVVAAKAPPRLNWLLPAAVGLVFLVVSLQVLLTEGVTRFWVNHVANRAGNQVWFDLLLAVCIAFFLIAPRARAAGMNLPLWGLAVITTASVALLPMLARLLWLERRS